MSGPIRERQRPDHARPHRLVLVTGLSGAGKSSILRSARGSRLRGGGQSRRCGSSSRLIGRSERPLAVGVDARTRGFDAGAVLDMMRRGCGPAGLRPELVYAWADETALLRRYTETRRRHPLAPLGRVTDGIAGEERLTAELKEAADLRRGHFRAGAGRSAAADRAAFRGGQRGARASRAQSRARFLRLPAGLPREADLVFDARFLRNPHYDPILRPLTGLDSEVGAYVEADPDYAAFFGMITRLLSLVLPRFVHEGKKYSTIAVGCTGGRHRSVHMVERLAAFLAEAGWRPNVTHRELARESGAARQTVRFARDGSAERAEGGASTAPAFQAQEA